MFSLLDQVVLRMLPVHQPRQLVLLSPHGYLHSNSSGQHALSYPMSKDFSDQSTAFSGVLARRALEFSMG